jgi:hypothetical protein
MHFAKFLLGKRTAMSKQPEKPKFDRAIHDENPEWTAEDFAKARPASELPPSILAQFPKTKLGRLRTESP